MTQANPRRTNGGTAFELKVRHAGLGEREIRAAVSARDSLKKDVVGLMGFDLRKTVDTWISPSAAVKSHIISTHLKDKASALKKSKCHFVSAYVQLGGSLNDNPIWDESSLRQQINKWASYKNIQAPSNVNFLKSAQNSVGLILVYFD